MLNLKQPAAGILGTAFIIAVAMGFISRFDFPAFAGWATYPILCIIPMQIVIGVVWRCKHPGFAARKTQPVKGALLVLVTLIVGAAACAAQFYVAGGGISPPTPMLVMCTIVSVVVTFWLAIMWGAWPFTALIKNPVAAGMTLLVASYVINYLLFRVFFNYDFMQGAPVYVPSLDPHGLFNAWNAMVYYVTSLGAMFLMLCFELWPLTKFPGVMKQPVLGLVWTAIAMALGAGALWIGVGAMGMDVVAFMVTVPVPFIFGAIVVLNMLQGSLLAKFEQPVKGVLNTIAVAIVGALLARMYMALAPALTGALKPGPPGYESEIWLASALLAVTFPFLIFYSEFFKLWPLKND